MPYIANFPLIDIKKGCHYDINNDTILIQICDPDTNFPKSPYQYRNKWVKIYQFRFLDTEEECDIYSIKDIDVQGLCDALHFAKDNNYNVIVHCHAGRCRSGAVVEAGLLLGFYVPDDHMHPRIPNLLVYTKLRTALGFTYSWEDIQEIVDRSVLDMI